MLNIWFYTILSVLLVSLISLVGILTLSIKTNKLKKYLIYLVSFSSAALFGDAFFHLLPELVENSEFTFQISALILTGIVLFFFIEKVVHWQHCHSPITDTHVHEFAIMNLVGDAVHNLIDGLIIGISYVVSIPAGIATTIAVGLHEIPQEIGDFGVLVHGGFSKSKALLLNFASGLLAVIGAIIALTLTNYVPNLQQILIPIAVGGFIYVAGSDLIPELNRHEFKTKDAILQLLVFILGLAVMAALLLLEI